MRKTKMTETEIDEEMKSMLAEGEKILIVAEQSRTLPGGSLFTPNTILVTNKRVLFKDPELLGLKANIIDMNYRDISNVRLKRGIFSTEIYLTSRFEGKDIVLPAVDKDIAQRVISTIQSGINGDLEK
jgi:Bacterial PH domain